MSLCSQGRHRAPRTPVFAPTARRALVVAGIGAASAVAVAGTATATSAATPSQWSSIAACESGSSWHINTGNGYYGGLQFAQSTWAGYGGSAYASRADLASPAQQQAVANRVLASQGWNAWPTCSRTTRLAGTSTSGGATSAASSRSATRRSTTSGWTTSAPRSSTRSNGTARPVAAATAAGAGSYTVRAGDTLSAIAAAQHLTGWSSLFAANRSTVSNPNLIFPGQVLRLP